MWGNGRGQRRRRLTLEGGRGAEQGGVGGASEEGVSGRARSGWRAQRAGAALADVHAGVGV